MSGFASYARQILVGCAVFDSAFTALKGLRLGFSKLVLVSVFCVGVAEFAFRIWNLLRTDFVWQVLIYGYALTTRI